MKKEPKTHNDHSYSQITDHLYLGYNMRCCEMHFQKLLSLGILVDVNVEAENEEDPTGMEIHLWLPTKEHEVPTQAQLLVGARAIQSAIQKDKTVYVHCEKGHARSVTVVAAYLVLEGEKPADALKLIKEKRSVTHPGEEHLTAVQEFYKSLQA